MGSTRKATRVVRKQNVSLYLKKLRKEQKLMDNETRFKGVKTIKLIKIMVFQIKTVI